MIATGSVGGFGGRFDGGVGFRTEAALSAVAGPCAAVFDGELLNAAALCRHLGLPPDTPAPALLLAGWQREAERFIARLDGVFSFALRDGDELLLYRDPSGLANLYYFTGRAGQLAFGSRLARLRSQLGAPLRLARRSLHEYLRCLDVAAPNTWFEDVFAVEAGSLLRWSRRGLSASEPAAPALPANAPSMTLDEAVAGLESRLAQAVAQCLAGAAQPAAFLSGGLDSALICALAARGRRDLTAITVGFDGPPHDEAAAAGRIAAHLGLRHEVLRFDRAECLAALETVGARFEQPLGDPASLVSVLAFARCAQRFDIVLDGTGADEAVGMMPARHVRMAVQYASLLPRPLRFTLARGMRAVPALRGQLPLVEFDHPADTMIRWHGFKRDEIEHLCGEPVSLAHTQFFRTYARFPRAAHFERYSALLNAMPCDRLSQAALATGLHLRYPFCSVPTDRYIRGLPVDLRYRRGQPKRIVRALFARHLPPALGDAPKHGFDFPLHDFLAADGHALVRRHLEPGLWEASGLLAPEPVARLARRFMAGERGLLFRVWSLVVLGGWLACQGPAAPAGAAA